MLTAIHPKLPMRDRARTRAFYVDQLQFAECGTGRYPDHLMVRREGIELHFFLFPELDPRTNYGQVYIRTSDIEALYHGWMAQGVAIHPNAPLQAKPWGQREFALLDPDHNLLTFGQAG